MTNKLIQKERIVPFSLTESWSKWTTHEGLKTFFGRDNKIELEIGGNFEIYFLMDNPVGLRGSETCKILSFLPREMLSFSWNAPPHFESIRNSGDKTWVVVLFLPIAENQTKIKLSHIGWPEGDDWELVYNYFDKAWNMVLEGMEI